MYEIETTYKLIKKLIDVKFELTNWARASREGEFSEINGKQMNIKALEIDNLLREIGTEWITDFEENMKLKNKIVEKKF
ncbi:MAG: hypothetical protein IPH62_08680 [Ignavibacteriae bacterium]|nr:hypothetical protein [Ignavibacteriota bacterium]